MTLRTRLALLTIVAALLPMAVVVGVPILRAGERARQEEAERLELARRMAAFVVDRYRSETAERVERAASELARDPDALASVVGGPEERAHEVARRLADKHGLDDVEVVSAAGFKLAASAPGESAGTPSPHAGMPHDRIVVAAGPERLHLYGARSVPFSGGESVTLVAGRALGEELVGSIAEIIALPVALVADGKILSGEGDAGARSGLVAGDVPLDDGGVAVRVFVLPGDVGRQRRDLLEAFASVAPLAVLAALALGVLVADRVSRPIRALAERADDIARSRSGFELLETDRNEVRRLTRSFDRMLDALSASEKERLRAERIAAWQDVARRIAHEVKNPLSPIKLAVENLRRTRSKAPGELDRALEVEAATILEEVESLRRLVDEFSEFARLPAPTLSACDPRQIVRQAMALFAPRSESLGVRVEIDDARAPETISADPEQIGRVLKNVFANALDALEPVADRRLAIVVQADGPHSRPDLRIEVRDSGVGFAPEALRRVFEPYYTTRAEEGGTGLGMAIAHRIVSEHGGSIVARSNSPGAGATITIRLPGR